MNLNKKQQAYREQSSLRNIDLFDIREKMRQPDDVEMVCKVALDAQLAYQDNEESNQLIIESLRG